MNDVKRKVVAGNQISPVCNYRESNPKFILAGTLDDGTPTNIPVGEQFLSRHALLLGGIGTGKTNAFNFLINNTVNNLSEDDVVIIFDTKGDFYKDFYQEGDIVISNDDKATGENGKDYWNIFKEITADERVEENLIEIANALFAEKIINSSQPFFPNAAKDIFFALVLHIIRKFPQNGNNEFLRDTFNSFSPEAMIKILNAHPDLMAMKSYISDPKSGQTLGVVSELQQAVREVFVGNFAKKGNLSIRDIIRKKGGKVVFIEYDLGIGAMLTPIYRILIDAAIKEALSRKSNEGNVYFFIDEFKLLPNLQHIDDGLNFGRSMGAKFFCGVQNVSQLYAIYGEHKAKSILAGFGSNLSFRVTDYETREYIKGLYGTNLRSQAFLATVNTRGLNEEVRETSVVEDSDIANLKLGQCLFSAVGNEPFLFQFPKY